VSAGCSRAGGGGGSGGRGWPARPHRRCPGPRPLQAVACHPCHPTPAPTQGSCMAFCGGILWGRFVGAFCGGLAHVDAPGGADLLAADQVAHAGEEEQLRDGLALGRRLAMQGGCVAPVAQLELGFRPVGHGMGAAHACSVDTQHRAPCKHVDLWQLRAGCQHPAHRGFTSVSNKCVHGFCAAEDAVPDAQTRCGVRTRDARAKSPGKVEFLRPSANAAGCAGAGA